LDHPSNYECIENDPQRPCSALIPLAKIALDRRDPGHFPIVASELRALPITRSSVFYAAVFRLADGSTRAIGVGYPGVSTTPMTIDYGP